MKKLLLALVVAAVAVGGFFALNNYLYLAKQAEVPPPDLNAYFKDKMIERGVADIGMPIEGFDANLLMVAYPGLAVDDFAGVTTFEGRYEVNGEVLDHVSANSDGPMTSAATTVADDGYATLLDHVTARLHHPVATESDVDALIDVINTSDRIEVAIGEVGSALNVAITPRELIEDSRCPSDVQCIQAGTVRVRATMVGDLGTSEVEFKLGETITNENTEVTLTNALPPAHSKHIIETEEYVFQFEVKRRWNTGQ